MASRGFVLDGLRELHKENFEDAARRFDAAVASDPGYLPALVGAARAAVARGRGKEAISRIDEAIYSDAGATFLRAEKARLLAQVGRPEEARVEELLHERLCEEDPDGIELKRAGFHEQMGELELAEKIYRRYPSLGE